MATNKTDFSNYTTGSTPSDWTVSWVTTSSTWAVREKTGTINGKCLEHTSTADARRFIYWTVPGTVTGDVEILVKWRTSDITLNNIPIRGHIHTTGTATASTQNAYTVDMTMSTPTTLRLGKTVSGTYGSLVTGALSFSIVANSWYWYRLGKSGNTVRCKCWADGTTEPTAWDLSASDTALTSGTIGVGAYDFNGTRDVAFFSYGTGTDVAPYPSIDIQSIVSGVSTVLGDVTPYRDIQATIQNQSTVLGDIDLDINITGIVAGQSSTDISLTVEAGVTALSGVIESQSSVDSNLLINRDIQSIVNPLSATDGNLLVYRDLQSIVSSQSSTNINLLITRDIQSIVSTSSSTDGNLLIYRYIQGLTENQSSLSADLLIYRYIQSVISSQSSADGTILATRDIQGITSGQSTVDSNLTAVKDIQSVVSGQSSIDTSLLIYRDIQGLIESQSSVLGDIATSKDVLLDGIISIQSFTSANLINLYSLQELTLGESITEGNIQEIFSLSGLVVNQSSISGNLSIGAETVVLLQSIVDDSSTIIANIILNLPVSGAVDGASASSGAITKYIDIQSIVSCNSSIQGNTTSILNVQSLVNSSSSIYGDLVFGATENLQSIINTNSNIIGNTLLDIKLQSESNGVSGIDAQLGKIVLIQSEILASAESVAVLTKYVYFSSTTITSDSGIDGLIYIDRGLNGASNSTSYIEGNLIEILGLESTIENQCSTSIDIHMDWVLVGVLDAVSEIDSNLTEIRNLQAQIQAESDILGYIAILIVTELQASFIDFLAFNGSAINNIGLSGEMKLLLLLQGEMIEILGLDGETKNKILLGGKF